MSLYGYERLLSKECGQEGQTGTWSNILTLVSKNTRSVELPAAPVGEHASPCYKASSATGVLTSGANLRLLLVLRTGRRARTAATRRRLAPLAGTMCQRLLNQQYARI